MEPKVLGLQHRERRLEQEEAREGDAHTLRNRQHDTFANQDMHRLVTNGPKAGQRLHTQTNWTDRQTDQGHTRNTRQDRQTHTV